MPCHFLSLPISGFAPVDHGPHLSGLCPRRQPAGQRELGWQQHEYLDLVEAQFLLDRLNSTSNAQEQIAILRLMCEIKKPLPIEALMAILADWETSTVFLRMEVAHTLAVVKAEEALDLFLCILLDSEIGRAHV